MKERYYYYYRQATQDNLRFTIAIKPGSRIREWDELPPNALITVNQYYKIAPKYRSAFELVRVSRNSLYFFFGVRASITYLLH